MLVHLGIERGLDGKLDQLLGEGAEIFFRFDVFGQLSGQCFEFVLVHLLTHEGILLKKLLIRGRLHNWIYRLRASESGRLTFTYPANKQHPKGVFKVYQSNRFATFEFSNGKFSYRITDQLVGPTTIYIEKEKKALSEFECITPAVPSLLDNESLRLFSLAGVIQ